MNNIKPNWGTLLGTAALLAAFFLGQCLDSPSDWEAEKATAASLRDAIKQAQSEHAWTDEQKRRAEVAVEIVAKGVGHE